jgi:hypothetical protein
MGPYPEWLHILSLAFLSFSFLFAGIIIIDELCRPRHSHDAWPQGKPNALHLRDSRHSGSVSPHRQISRRNCLGEGSVRNRARANDHRRRKLGVGTKL